MTAEVMFKEYQNLKREQSVLQFQLSQFKEIEYDEVIAAMCFSHPTGEDISASGGISDKTAKAAMKYRKIAERENEDWRNFLRDRYREIHEELAFFDHCVSELEGILPDVVKDLLEGELTWDSMMKKYNVSHAMIGKYRKAAIKEINIRYKLRDKQTEAYILS